MAQQRGRARSVLPLGALPLAVIVVLLIGVLLAQPRAWWPTTGTSDPGTSDTQLRHSSPVDAAAQARALRLERTLLVEGLLAARGHAMMARDREAYLSLLAADAPQLHAEQAALFDNLAGVPLQKWAYQVVDVRLGANPSASQDSFTAHVQVAHRLVGSDPGDIDRTRAMTFSRQDQRWVITKDQPVTGTPVDPWDLGPVQVRTGQRATVIAAESGAPGIDMDAVVAEADQAARRVDAVWGAGWPRRSVVFVPASQQDMARMLGRAADDGLTQIAAVTTGEVAHSGEGTKGQAGRIIVNPESYRELGSVGRQVIVTHEMTHVATRASTTAEVPTWLSEGFADYVAYQDTGLSARRVAGSAVTAIRSGGVPEQLPGDDRFDPRAYPVDAAYAQSWLAVQLIAQRSSQQALVQLYREVAEPADGAPSGANERVDAALRSRAGLSVAELTQLWRAELSQLASG